MIRAVFIDKDGTLIENVPFNVDPRLIRLLPGAAEGLRTLAADGFRLFVVSNQSGVARGYFKPEALDAVEARLTALLSAEGISLDGVYWCPHLAEGSVAPYAVRCSCRKPAPGMLLRAAGEHDIDLKASWIAGDILNDVEAGHRAGCRAVLVDNGGETEWVPGRHRTPDHVATDLTDAARFILAQPNVGRQHEEARRGQLA